jgi:hypothetical protein
MFDHEAWRDDLQHNDIFLNDTWFIDTQHIRTICDTENSETHCSGL